MRNKTSRTRLKTISYIRPGIIALLVLMIPLIAMQFSEEVNWGPGDFVGMGIFIYVFGLIFEFAMVKLPKHRKIAGGLILLVFFTLYVLMARSE